MHAKVQAMADDLLNQDSPVIYALASHLGKAIVNVRETRWFHARLCDLIYLNGCKLS